MKSQKSLFGDDLLLTISILLAITFLLLCVSLYFNYKHGILILRTIDGIEGALDMLDQKYSSISEILEIPLFYDSPQIRKVHEDLKESRDTILKVANLLGTVEELELEKEKEDEILQ